MCRLDWIRKDIITGRRIKVLSKSAKEDGSITTEGNKSRVVTNKYSIIAFTTLSAVAFYEAFKRSKSVGGWQIVKEFFLEKK